MTTTSSLTMAVYDRLPESLMRPAWVLYRDTFDTLAHLAVQRHVMDWFDFAEIMDDPRIAKYVATGADGEVVGLGAQTSDLRAVPLIEPRYFVHHYPDLYAARKIWYVLFIGTRQRPRPALHTFRNLLIEMSAPTARAQGVTFLDYCAHNVVARHMPEVTGQILSAQYGKDVPEIVRVDRQEYYLYDFTGARP